MIMSMTREQMNAQTYTHTHTQVILAKVTERMVA